MVWMTPRAAELTMWLTGLVTLMLMKPAMQMRKPKRPCTSDKRAPKASERCLAGR